MTIVNMGEKTMNRPLFLQIENSINKLSLHELLWLIERLTQHARELIFTKEDASPPTSRKDTTQDKDGQSKIVAWAKGNLPNFHSVTASETNDISKADYKILTEDVLNLSPFERLTLLKTIVQSLDTETQQSPPINNIDDLAIETWSNEETEAFDRYLAESRTVNQYGY